MSIARACERCQQRIRELEAELVGWKNEATHRTKESDRRFVEIQELKARAEKAEAELEVFREGLQVPLRARGVFAGPTRISDRSRGQDGRISGLADSLT